MRKKSGNYIKNTKKKLVCVLMAALAVQTTGCSLLHVGTEKIPGAIVRAQYPEMAQYPKTNGWYYNEEDYNDWRASRRAQQPDSTEYRTATEGFCKETMVEFLGNAEGENKIYSPLNIYMALAMLAETTEGTSREQLLSLLHTEDIETLREYAKKIWNANYCDDGTVNSLLASSMWLADSVNYKEETLRTLAETYYASSFQGKMGSKEYDKALQNWLNQQTGSLLEEQAGNIHLNAETVLALATTANFQAKWDGEFNENNTKEGTFHGALGDVNCEFMHQSGSDTYYWGEKFSAISKRFENSGSMLFVLPDEGVPVEELLSDEEVQNFIHTYYDWENNKYLIVNRAIPKFDVASDFDMSEGLKNLGITDIFNWTVSDFSPLLADEEKEVLDVEVSSAKHAARVAIDEEGCTAVAFTVIAMAGAAAPPEEEIDFVLDRPFLFVIEGQDNQPLFIGIVNQP